MLKSDDLPQVRGRALRIRGFYRERVHQPGLDKGGEGRDTDPTPHPPQGGRVRRISWIGGKYAE